MTERQELWMEIAEAYGTPEGERIERRGGVACDGLCNAVRVVCPNIGDHFQWGIAPLFAPRDTYPRREQKPLRCPGYFWFPYYENHDSERSIFACMMASISDEDYDEMVAA